MSPARPSPSGGTVPSAAVVSESFERYSHPSSEVQRHDSESWRMPSPTYGTTDPPSPAARAGATTLPAPDGSAVGAVAGERAGSPASNGSGSISGSSSA